MKKLPEIPEWAEDVMVPEDGVDRRTASSLHGAFMALADRTAWLRENTTGTGGGVTRIRSVPGLPELKAITDRKDGDVIRVGRLGLYHFEADATDSAAEPLIIAPASGGGRWFHASTDVVGIPGGIASLGANGKVPDAQLGRGQANGVASLGANGRVLDAQLGRGSSNGVASLGPTGLVPFNQLPRGVPGGVAPVDNDGTVHNRPELASPGAPGGTFKGGSGSTGTSTFGGYGVVAEAGDSGGQGLRSALRIVPQDTPDAAQAGDVYYDSTANVLKVNTDEGWKTLAFTPDS